SDNNLNSFVDYLYVPFSVKKFCLSDDRIILSVVNRGVLLGEFDFEQGIITDSIPLVNNPTSIFETDTFLVFVHNRGLDLVHKEQHDIYDFTINDILPSGDIYQMHAINYLFLPNISGGFSLYNINDVELVGTGIQGLKRFGEIKDIMFFNDKFYTAGEGNPIDIYSFDFDNKPVYDTSIAEGLRYVSSLESLNDDLFALYRLPGMIAIYSWVFDEGPAYIKDFKDSIEVDPIGNPELYISDKMFNDSLRLALMIKDASIDIFTINDLNKIEYRNNYRYTGRIEGFVLDGNKLFVATNKKLLYISEIDSLYNLNSQPIMSLNMDPDEMIYLKGSLAIFGGSQIQFFDYSDISNLILDTTLTGQVNALDAVVYGDSLYTVTNEYIGIFDITSRWPMLVDSGGYGGKMISVTDNMIAVSNGFSLDFYDISEEMPTSIESEYVYLPTDFELGQNYPNPFNSSTVVQFSIEKKSDVKLSIYNTLGRKIITVLDNYLSAGQYSVEWDGSRNNGDKVASGIYFYRLSVNNQIKSKKMLLLK
ncbi:MAG: T9SS type A sorting domain-containing protein, partial [candidate division Zixibacteria bacterium]|nr:T9SS type A sorting domain-containing protein [candidate division Zixibacteria bacterium]